MSIDQKGYTIGIAFLSSTRPVEGRPIDLSMLCFSRLTDWYHNTTDKPSYVHCALVLKNHEGEEYVYHYDRNGPRREHRKPFLEKIGWDCFRVKVCDRETYDKCLTYVEAIHQRFQEDFQPRYDTLVTRVPCYGQLRIPLAPFRFIPIIKYCIPWGNELFYCSDYVCRALQYAEVPEVSHLYYKETTSHMLFEAVKHLPAGGPGTIEGLEPMV
jgi:hypothetical protein